MWNSLGDVQRSDSEQGEHIVGFPDFFTEHEIITPELLSQTYGLGAFKRPKQSKGGGYEEVTITAVGSMGGAAEGTAVRELAEMLRDAEPDYGIWDGTDSDPERFLQGVRNYLATNKPNTRTERNKLKMRLKKLSGGDDLFVTFAPTGDTERSDVDISISGTIEINGKRTPIEGWNPVLASPLVSPEVKVNLIHMLFGFSRKEMALAGIIGAEIPQPKPARKAKRKPAS